jgi:glyoxylase-like metal-dependent hydrolase (beta-lactamase superfamily II)
MMKIHYISGSGTDGNVYLVEAKKPVLIDTGIGLYVERTVENIKRIVSPEKIDKIVLTHRHFDHVGGASKLKEILNAKLYIHTDDAAALMEGDERSTGAWMYNGSLQRLNVERLNDEDVVDCGDVNLEVIHTPGHTIGSISLYEPKSKSLISGDTVFTHGGVGRWDMDTGNYDQLLSSLKKLSKMDVVNLYPGHGPYAEGNGKEHILLALKYLDYTG